VLEYLSQSYELTAFFYNPNIRPREEYNKRLAEFQRFLALSKSPADLIIGEYDADDFESISNPFNDEPEGGRRCEACFDFRLDRTAEHAARDGYDCFTTTLSVSPHKNATLLNEIGNKLTEKHSVEYLCADFKKRDGYKRSITLSKQYGLYRQTYCGCLPLL